MQGFLLSWRGLLIDMTKRFGKNDRVFLGTVFFIFFQEKKALWQRLRSMENFMGHIL